VSNVYHNFFDDVAAQFGPFAATNTLPIVHSLGRYPNVKAADFQGYAQIRIHRAGIKHLRTLRHSDVRNVNDYTVDLSVTVYQNDTGKTWLHLPSSALQCDDRVWMDVVVVTPEYRALMVAAVRNFLIDHPL
jgi:hypothetical protein